jgi:release factor glutamine methyltransferase
MMNERTQGTTVREAYTQASSFLQQRSNTQDPSKVSEWLLLHLLGWNRTDFFLRWNAPFPEHQREEWERLLSRKAAGEPVQYIIGEQEFYGLPFQVNSAVLIPRPETEVLVEEIMKHGQRIWCEGEPKLADIGTGSGAIPVTIAVHMPNWRIYASDISPEALKAAHINAETHQVGDRVHFYQGDLLMPFIDAEISLDIVVSNPPYIPSAEIPTLQPEVQRFEPMLALDGGEDGLDFYIRLIDQMAKLPEYPKLVGFEVGMGQAKQVADMLAACNQWEEIEIIPDLSGIDRHILGWK